MSITSERDGESTGVSDSLRQLLDLLSLERLENNLFRGRSRDIVGPRVFGGQVLGQALMAAASTVGEPRFAHSLHAYFMRPGDGSAPIVYEVDRIRDGGSFTTRRVVAIQHGRAIFSLSSSFQIDEEGADHQSDMPDAPAPETLRSARDLVMEFIDDVPPAARERLTREHAIDMRPVEPGNPFGAQVQPARQMVWMRAAGELPEDRTLHRVVLAFASDFNLLGASLRPHALSFFQRDLQAASLDHAMWFHRELRMDQWLLYVMQSPSASNARGFSRGSIFSRDGRLVASVVQEGLIRFHRP